jgi:ribonuclease P protein component
MMRKNEASFTKRERLCSVKTISDLFAGGRTLNLPPLRVIYMVMPETPLREPVRLLISVPKRYFKKAVDRNLIRRRIREAYRQNKMPLISALAVSGKHLDVAILWNDTAILSYDITVSCIKEMIGKLSHLK